MGGKPGDSLAPTQFHSPDMAHESLHVGGPADVARQLQQCRVGFEVRLPEVVSFLVLEAQRQGHHPEPGRKDPSRVVAGEIARLLNGNTKIGQRRLKPEDIAVLVMENQQARKMQEALSDLNIPSVLHTTASLFQSQEVLEFRRILAGVALPGDERLVKAALATDLFGVDGAQLSACTESQWQEWLQRFHEYLDLWDRRGFFRMFRHWMQREGVRQRLLAFPDGERRLTNVLHLGEVLHQAETERRLGISGLLKWLAEQMDPGMEAAEEHQLRLERDENAVRLVTVHKSKGLQYPVVFCAFSWKHSEIERGGEEQVFFHDPKREHRLVRDLGPEISDDHRNLAREEKLAENVRLLYVALTRAKNRCYLVWGGMKNSATSAPAWLFHRPPNLNGSIIPALRANFPLLSDPRMLGDLERLKENSGGTFALADMPKPAGDPYRPEDAAPLKLECREFKGRISRDWLICSFSYFKAGKQEELPDRDNVPPAKREEIPGTGIFAFPKGAKAGTCLHEILQKLDFGATEEVMETLANERLQAHDLAQPGNSAAVCEALRTTLRFPLDPERPDFNLTRISAAERLSELEFYFPVKGVSLPRLQSAHRVVLRPEDRRSATLWPQPRRGRVSGSVPAPGPERRHGQTTAHQQMRRRFDAPPAGQRRALCPGSLRPALRLARTGPATGRHRQRPREEARRRRRRPQTRRAVAVPLETRHGL